MHAARVLQVRERGARQYNRCKGRKKRTRKIQKERKTYKQRKSKKDQVRILEDWKEEWSEGVREGGRKEAGG